MNEPDNPDPLAAPRGCINGFFACAPFWVVVLVMLGVLLRGCK
jgi:hypothetical protein